MGLRWELSGVKQFILVSNKMLGNHKRNRHEKKSMWSEASQKLNGNGMVCVPILGMWFGITWVAVETWIAGLHPQSLWIQ